ncbi:hypothetical protein BEWA_031540 [Theileria equi strain WA]|uniref:Uncharacterized protein n=1 Tax=Theileria equi strain WA TaxID=1537102 RepID=L0AZ60_THEEQ|nr:hypothetical protein BEWA_031540 [Theileria equi strain WA]AFZ80301.1 hypothetical protein BEWA_031540 [Theileria equi strain WA]|eukprot:XP_004829967.1 hypothetical protein BEWA_031540 [Theileria equi strain WA]
MVSMTLLSSLVAMDPLFPESDLNKSFKPPSAGSPLATSIPNLQNSSQFMGLHLVLTSSDKMRPSDCRAAIMAISFKTPSILWSMTKKTFLNRAARSIFQIYERRFPQPGRITCSGREASIPLIKWAMCRLF